MLITVSPLLNKQTNKKINLEKALLFLSNFLFRENIRYNHVDIVVGSLQKVKIHLLFCCSCLDLTSLSPKLTPICHSYSRCRGLKGERIGVCLINAVYGVINQRIENMPQDSFRSVVYRSFVTCDDPKGVAEDATIRKSKADSQKMEGKIRTEGQRQLQTLIKSSSCKEGGNKAKELDDNPSSFHLMEVKKGAQKLNQVIDSWSKGVTFEGQSKDIAKDLLKGALDLQESLTMLGKLQEASQHMARLKKKEKEKVYEIKLERTSSERLENRNYELGGFQKPRISVDGSSRDCYEELRDVIRDSLGRQNLLPNSSHEQRAYQDRRKVEMSPDMPSTSSSRSSVAYSYEFASTDSFSSKMPEEKIKGSNLIAKLMGLEDISSKSLQPDPQKQLERDKAVTPRRPIFDIDLPMTRKPRFVVQKVDREPMTLDKIIEVMHSKGLLRSNYQQSFCSNSSYLEKRFGDDSPPIVLMKPHHPEVLHTCTFPQETRVFENGMARNWKSEDEFPPKIKKVNYVVMHEQETFVKNLRKEKGGGDFKEKAEQAKDEVKITGKSYSPKVKFSGSASRKPQKMEVIEKKVDKIQKLAPKRKKPLETDNVKPSSNHKPRQQEKVTLSKESKPEARSNSVKRRQISPQKTSTASPIQKTSRTTSPIRKRPSLLKSSDNNKKNVKIEKPVSKPVATNFEKNGSETDVKQIGISCDDESDLTMMYAAPAVHKEELFDDKSISTEQDSGFEAPEEVNCCSSPEITKSNCADINHDSDELLDIDAYQAAVLQTISFPESETSNSKLLLDYANELLDHTSLRQIPAIHPSLQNRTIKSRFRISVDQLTKYVNDGLENLSGYSKCTKKAGPRADTIHGMLERDLWWKGDVGGAWDMGWRDGYSLEEVEELVGDLEKLVLSELIENVVNDFLC